MDIKDIKLKKKFFGWTNFKWAFKEFVKMYSNQPSFFSKKRIESGLAFIILQWGMIYYLLEHEAKMDMMEMSMWAGIEAIICGYAINKIEKEKQTSKEEKSTDSV